MPRSFHPTEQALVAFTNGDSTAQEAKTIVRHLLAGCESCGEIARRHWPFHQNIELTETPLRALATDEVAEHEERIEEDRRRSERLFRELEEHPPNRRLLLVLNSARFHSWFLAVRLLDRVAELGFSDPVRALELAELAVALTERISEERYSAALANDIRARAWGALANARRINSDLSGAGEAFRTAVDYLERGSGDPLEEARLLSWRASYLNFRRKLDQAVRLFDKAGRIYRQMGDAHGAGRALIDKGAALSAAGDYAGAIDATERGLELIDQSRDPRVALAARHNLSLYHHHVGDVERATVLLREILPLYRQQNDAMVLLRLRWLEGHLAQAQGEMERAEGAYREVQQGFLEREIPYEAAAASFDLATILLEQGRFEELEELSAQVLAVFSGLQVPRETLAALQLLCKTVEARQLTAAWIADLAAYLETSRDHPGRPFEPSF